VSPRRDRLPRPPGDRAGARLLWWVLAVFAAGTVCCAASMILAFTWAATGAPALLTAAHWLTRCAYAFLAAILVLGVLLGRRERRRQRDEGGGGS
jgi:membrane protein implicated in regulation of membrane protease activity